MGWSFRRTIKMGPLKVNVSSGGLGLSTGVRGARVSVGPRGTYVTFGRGVFRYRHKIRSARTTPRQQLPQDPRQLPAGTSTPGFITTASSEELADMSPDATLLEVQAHLKRKSLFLWFVLVAAFIAVWAACVLPFEGTVAVCVLLLATAFPVKVWDNERRTARILYDVDDSEVVNRIGMANSVGLYLKKASELWHVFYSVKTDDWKKNAGANALIQRTAIRVLAGTLPHVELNIEPSCIPVGPQQLLFLPDRLLIWDGTGVAGIPYEQLDVRASTTSFIEEGRVPPDSRRIDTTWRFVRKDGGPDLRFSNNAQLPIMEYGRLELTSQSGLKVVLQTSTPAAAEGAATALTELSRRAAATSSVAGIPTT